MKWISTLNVGSIWWTAGCTDCHSKNDKLVTTNTKPINYISCTQTCGLKHWSLNRSKYRFMPERDSMEQEQETWFIWAEADEGTRYRCGSIKGKGSGVQADREQETLRTSNGEMMERKDLLICWKKLRRTNVLRWVRRVKAVNEL